MSALVLPDLLWRTAEASPDAVAVVDGDREISYGELTRRAGRLARLLRECGAIPGERVGVHLEKSADAIVALYAILASGAAYVPLDPDAPPVRSASVLRDCGVRLVVSEATRADEWPVLLTEGARINTLVLPTAPTTSVVDAPSAVTVLAGDAVEAQASTRPSGHSAPSDLAYVLYTSGSTGKPKGISLTHANALSFVEWAVAEFEVRAQDRVSSHAPFHFDLSVFDLYATAHAGATVTLVPRSASAFPRELGRFIQRQRVTVWYSVPWVLVQVAERAGLETGSLPTLRVVLFAGEAFPVRQLRRLTMLIPHARFANLYGPTECNVCTWHEVGELSDSDVDIPIGMPIGRVETVVVRGTHRAAVGEIGELFVRGPTVMRGYWGDPERTAAALVPDPLGRGEGERWLRTGDLAEVLADGSLRFRGRRDAQVKHRGHRVELGDVESAVAANTAVAECAVVMTPDDRVRSRLVAYVVRAKPVDATEVRRACAELLPRYMVPDRIEFVTTLPRTSTGKTDRRALEAMERSRQPEGR